MIGYLVRHFDSDWESIPEIFIKILNSTYFKTGLSEIKGSKMVKNKFNPTFYLRNMLKDLELVTNTAQDIGFSLHIATITQQIYRQQIISDFPTMTIQQY